VAKQWKDREGAASLLEQTGAALAEAPAWNAAALEESLRSLAERIAVGGGKIFQPLRVALTGLTVSPGIFDVLVMLGRERSIARIVRAVAYLRAV
jgi:glutamyl-tRNA synthetase